MAVAHALKADGIDSGAGIGTHDHLYSVFYEGLKKAAARGADGLYVFATLDFYKRCIVMSHLYKWDITASRRTGKGRRPRPRPTRPC